MPTEQNLSIATLAQLRGWYLDGSLTPADYLAFCLTQIDRHNPKINAVLDIYTDTAIAAAAASSERYAKGEPRSVIDGMPIGVKANIAVRGYPCHAGIEAYSERTGKYDADIVHQLRRAGAIIIGSLNMEEGALGAQTDNPWFGKTYNPIKDGFTPGGSSGGSAAAVAAGMMPASLGTDTMGSVRIPSSYCGIVGFKPSPGTYSTKGVIPFSTTLDTVGTHTRTVEDAVMIYQAVTGFNGQIEARAPRNLSPFDISESDVQDDVVAAFTRALKVLEVPMNDPILSGYDYSKQRRAGLIISEYEGAHYHAAKDYMNSDGFSDHFKSMLAFGEKQTPEKIKETKSRLSDAADMADGFFRAAGGLIAPTAPQTAFKFGETVPANQADFTAFANFAGLPALSLPIGLDSDQLPIGLQVMAKSGRDRALLGMALYCETKFQ